tara:strand:- start:20718 stop:21041 length:324 start_codon:yes stop_codon:yes gene_type:complete
MITDLLLLGGGWINGWLTKKTNIYYTTTNNNITYFRQGYFTKKPVQMNWFFYVVGVAGFEPATSSSQTRRDDRATLHPVAIVVQIYTIAIVKQVWQTKFSFNLKCHK